MYLFTYPRTLRRRAELKLSKEFLNVDISGLLSCLKIKYDNIEYIILCVNDSCIYFYTCKMYIYLYIIYTHKVISCLNINIAVVNIVYIW